MLKRVQPMIWTRSFDVTHTFGQHRFPWHPEPPTSSSAAYWFIASTVTTFASFQPAPRFRYIEKAKRR
jgi:hypothetical protein